MNVDYTAISSWAAVIAALTAVYAIWAEGKRARFSQGLDLLQKLSNEFNSDPFKEKRRAIAKILLKDKNQQAITKKDTSTLKTTGTDILDHFQTVGILMRRGILDEELVYSEYFFWLEGYWICLQKVYSAFSEVDITVWEDAQWLYKLLKKFEKKLPPKGKVVEPTEEDLKYFLEYECRLM